MSILYTYRFVSGRGISDSDNKICPLKSTKSKKGKRMIPGGKGKVKIINNKMDWYVFPLPPWSLGHGREIPGSHPAR